MLLRLSRRRPIGPVARQRGSAWRLGLQACAAASLLWGGGALAQTSSTGTAATAGSNTAAAPASPSTPTLTPSLAPGLTANPDPLKLSVPGLPPVFVTGILNGYGSTQDHPIAGDRRERLDLQSQIFVQTTEGPVQFYLQAGTYKIPSLGTLDRNALDTTRLFFGPVAAGYVKLAPTDDLSIIAGKLPTLIGGESTFTFQNMQIERGLLFNQTNGINRGVQVNYTVGPVTVAASLNDGFYSDRFNWVSGQVIWKVDGENTLSFDAGANMGRTPYTTVAAPLLQNNSSIYNLIYTHTEGAWTINPYLQYSNVGRDASLGILQSASAYGAALLASYAFTSEWSLAGRLEYIAQTGERGFGSTSLLYGPGSQAASVTVTPTYQHDRFFVRGEYSFVRAIDATPGLAFGRTGDRTSQNRFLLETGILF